MRLFLLSHTLFLLLGPAQSLPSISNHKDTRAVLPTNTNANISTGGSAPGVGNQFWAGADIGTTLRMEAIPGRKFFDYDGTTIKDPIQTLADAGVNVLRVEGQRGQCLGPTTSFNDTGDTLAKELLFQLDWGCMDLQVKTAQRGAKLGMKVVLTINQGKTIPRDMEGWSYAQMVKDVQKETKRQLGVFLEAKIVPDVILLENEGTDGFLFLEASTGHARGTKDGKGKSGLLDDELCGKVPTGNTASFAQYAGYLKAEILACEEAITAAGFDAKAVRYGMHSHAQYVDWKEGLVHGEKAANDTDLKGSSGKLCTDMSLIPDQLLKLKIADMLNIAGFSAYPDPMEPTGDSDEAMDTMLARPLKSLTLMQVNAERYGKFTDGPFKGQYKLQALGVEWATRYPETDVPAEQKLTSRMWEKVKAFDSFLGMMWWEPWYCYNDWEGGDAAMCKKVKVEGGTGEAPTGNLKTWGAAAISPWKINAGRGPAEVQTF